MIWGGQAVHYVQLENTKIAEMLLLFMWVTWSSKWLLTTPPFSVMSNPISSSGLLGITW